MVGKGAIVEFDFAAMKGARLLFDTTSRFLRELDGIPFDVPLEARHFAGRSYQEGLESLFAAVRSKKTVQKAARDLAAAFTVALTSAVPTGLTSSFRNFVRTLTDRGVKVVLVTCADIGAVTPAFEPLLGENVRLCGLASTCYGSLRWDAWRHVCSTMKFDRRQTIAVTGSGFGVKSALQAGMGAMAVVNDHVAYQDFGGADEVVDELSGATARAALRMLRV